MFAETLPPSSSCPLQRGLPLTVICLDNVYLLCLNTAYILNKNSVSIFLSTSHFVRSPLSCSYSSVFSPMIYLVVFQLPQRPTGRYLRRTGSLKRGRITSLKRGQFSASALRRLWHAERFVLATFFLHCLLAVTVEGLNIGITNSVHDRCLRESGVGINRNCYVLTFGEI